MLSAGGPSPGLADYGSGATTRTLGWNNYAESVYMQLTERWTADQLVLIGSVSDLSGDDIVTIDVGTPIGTVRIMFEVVSIDGARLEGRGCHIESSAGEGEIGLANIFTVARFLLSEFDLDEARMEGAPRTTGVTAGTGRLGRYRFER